MSVLFYLLCEEGVCVNACERESDESLIPDVAMKPLVIEARANQRTESPKIRNRRTRKKVVKQSVTPDKWIWALLISFWTV